MEKQKNKSESKKEGIKKFMQVKPKRKKIGEYDEESDESFAPSVKEQAPPKPLNKDAFKGNSKKREQKAKRKESVEKLLDSVSESVVDIEESESSSPEASVKAPEAPKKKARKVPLPEDQNVKKNKEDDSIMPEEE